MIVKIYLESKYLMEGMGVKYSSRMFSRRKEEKGRVESYLLVFMLCERFIENSFCELVKVVYKWFFEFCFGDLVEMMGKRII